LASQRTEVKAGTNSDGVAGRLTTQAFNRRRLHQALNPPRME
jgi:hypothetical protein